MPKKCAPPGQFRVLDFSAAECTYPGVDPEGCFTFVCDCSSLDEARAVADDITPGPIHRVVYDDKGENIYHSVGGKSGGFDPRERET